MNATKLVTEFVQIKVIKTRKWWHLALFWCRYCQPWTHWLGAIINLSSIVIIGNKVSKVSFLITFIFQKCSNLHTAVFQKFGNKFNHALTHFSPVFYFISPLNHQKTKSFMTFSGAIKRITELGLRDIQWLISLLTIRNLFNTVFLCPFLVLKLVLRSKKRLFVAAREHNYSYN